MKLAKKTDAKHLKLFKDFGNSIGRATLSRSDDYGEPASGLRTFLQAILEGTIEKQESPYPEDWSKYMKTAARSFTRFNGSNAAVILGRLEAFFANGDWEEAWENSLPSTTTSIDTGKAVRTVGMSENSYFRNKKTGEIFGGSATMTGVILHLYSTSRKLDPSIVEEFVIENILEPNPYKGRIVRINDESEVSFMKPMDTEGLEAYSPEVESAVLWLTSIEDPEVRKDLDAAGLPARAGLILEGPPGSGKTTLSRRIASEKKPETTVLYPEAGTSASVIADFASNFDSVIVVLEDVESFFGERGSEDLSEFLNYMDGADSHDGTMILATTNDSSDFDVAIRRAGRLERSVVVGGVKEGAYESMLRARIPSITDETIARIGAHLEVIAKLGTTITPSHVDSISRSAIMLRLEGVKLAEYVENEWRIDTEGNDYTKPQAEKRRGQRDRGSRRRGGAEPLADWERELIDDI